MTFAITRGFPDGQVAEAAALYWQAFGGKLGRVMWPEHRALAYVRRVIRPDHALAAMGEGGQILGVAGFRSPQGSFVGGGGPDLRAVYGIAGGAVRGRLLSLLCLDSDSRRFLVDGLCVRPDRRGQGIGRALIEALCHEARARGYAEIRLDVVGENLRARALYERAGFEVAGTLRAPFTGPLYGFGTVVTMVRAV